jgi:predicted RNA-binding protein with PUA-like domain
MKQKKQYWLFKTEPESFSIDDLARMPNKRTCWDGVRNFQARNFLRDTIQVGDEVFFYHSNADPPAIVGIAKVVTAGYPDHTAFDRKDPHFDPKSNRSNPTWYMVDIEHVETFPQPIGLPELKAQPSLADMVLLQRSRLSIQPVSDAEWKQINALSKSRV